jgi:hypothetical protein
MAKHHITQVCQLPSEPRFDSLRLLAFPKAKIAVEREEIIGSRSPYYQGFTVTLRFITVGRTPLDE